MRRIFIAFAGVLLIWTATSEPAWAKSPTTKLTISGGALANVIEVIDPQVLSISSVWGGQFLELSSGVAEQPPSGLQRYEVWFYTSAPDSQARKRYVVYYSPSVSSGERGYVYLPGKGEAWYSLNVSAMLRDGRDGKWSYASPAWESLIKAAIARAEAAPAPHR